ncbi:MAG: dihydroneopterin aldolase [Chitinispirillaceae bacterium]|nr:dihydroneopterin aldolase [Chitinispirillaceae bacterium]
MHVHHFLATARITNLRLDAVIGCNDWERNRTQEIVINLTMEFDPAEALAADRLGATLDYRAIKKKIIASVAASSFNLLESLTSHILNLVMEEPRVVRATVTVDKPKALRFADSVSITLSAHREP